MRCRDPDPYWLAVALSDLTEAAAAAGDLQQAEAAARMIGEFGEAALAITDPSWRL